MILDTDLAAEQKITISDASGWLECAMGYREGCALDDVLFLAGLELLNYGLRIAHFDASVHQP